MPTSSEASKTEKLYSHPNGMSVVVNGQSWRLRDEDGGEIARGIGRESLVAALAPLREDRA